MSEKGHQNNSYQDANRNDNLLASNFYFTEEKGNELSDGFLTEQNGPNKMAKTECPFSLFSPVLSSTLLFYCLFLRLKETNYFFSLLSTFLLFFLTSLLLNQTCQPLFPLSCGLL